MQITFLDWKLSSWENYLGSEMLYQRKINYNSWVKRDRRMLLHVNYTGMNEIPGRVWLAYTRSMIIVALRTNRFI